MEVLRRSELLVGMTASSDTMPGAEVVDAGRDEEELEEDRSSVLERSLDDDVEAAVVVVVLPLLETAFDVDPDPEGLEGIRTRSSKGV